MKRRSKILVRGVAALGLMAAFAMPLQGQVSEAKQLSTDVPRLTSEQKSTSAGMTWVIAGVLAAGIILLSFKNAKRNHLD